MTLRPGGGWPIFNTFGRFCSARLYMIARAAYHIQIKRGPSWSRRKLGRDRSSLDFRPRRVRGGCGCSFRDLLAARFLRAEVVDGCAGGGDALPRGGCAFKQCAGLRATSQQTWTHGGRPLFWSRELRYQNEAPVHSAPPTPFNCIRAEFKQLRVRNIPDFTQNHAEPQRQCDADHANQRRGLPVGSPRASPGRRSDSSSQTVAL